MTHRTWLGGTCCTALAVGALLVMRAQAQGEGPQLLDPLFGFERSCLA